MKLLIVIVLVAVLIVIGIYLIKNTLKRPRGNQEIIARKTLNSSGQNPGSIPDKPGTKGDGNSALSSGQQG